VDSWSGYNIENNAGQFFTSVVMYCNMPAQINFLTFGALYSLKCFKVSLTFHDILSFLVVND